MRLILDTGILGQLVHPQKRVNQAIVARLDHLLGEATQADVIYLPEIAFYELRRKLVHLLRKQQESIAIVDNTRRLVFPLSYQRSCQKIEFWLENDDRIGVGFCSGLCGILGANTMRVRRGSFARRVGVVW